LKPFFKNAIMPTKPPKTSTTNKNMNLEAVAMDNFCKEQQTNHFEKTYSWFINIIELFNNESTQLEISTINN